MLCTSMLIQKVFGKIMHEYAQSGMPLLFSVFIFEKSVPCDMQVIFRQGEIMPTNNNCVNNRNFATQNFCDCEGDYSGPPELHMDSDSDKDYNPSSSSSSNEECLEQKDLDSNNPSLSQDPVERGQFFSVMIPTI